MIETSAYVSPLQWSAGPLSVAVEVTHHKDDGAAWGSYVVFMVMPSPGAGGPRTPQIQATRGGSAHAIGAPSIY